MGKKLKTYFRLLAEDREQGKLADLMYPMLKAASKVYARGVEARRQKFARQENRRRLKFPVISVGNLTWGGTGKTPLVEYIVRLISDAQKTPLILSRGYSHDEIEQYRQHLPRVLIGVGKDRYETAERAAQKNRIDAAVLDDGFQHWALERDLEIVTVNTLNPFGNGELVPRGPLREPVEGLNRADLVVLTHVNLVKPEELEAVKKKITELAPRAGIVESYLEPLFFFRARKRQRVPIERLQNQRVTTFSAVGVPRSFQLILAHSLIRPVRNFEFTDHHEYSKRDLEEIKYVSEAAASHEVITTEKDFYRSPGMIADVFDPLVLATRLSIGAGEELLKSRILRLLGGHR
ncbi:MAG: tetraacyldisaccharide 4'-kinase [Candidatus Omnitrophica bacterium]|nr:tetraacyldisaccharide 4'-kinase [Candidatus Omnitrophota bacterium]